MSRLRAGLVSAMMGLIVFSAGPATAGPVRLGAHGGLSVPNIRGSETDVFSRGFTSRRGPYFGLFAEFDLGLRFSLVTELNYTSQGGRRNGMQLITDPPPGLPLDIPFYANFKNETVLDYVELPVLGRITFGKMVHFFLNVGPYAGYLIRAKAVTGGSSPIYLDQAGTQPIVPSPVSFDAETDVMESLKKWNAGLIGGGGVRFAAGPGDIVLEAHFQLGLLTIQKDAATSGNSKTGAVVISAGYSFLTGDH
jgi:hypothetical protein